jgi:hypothetical protein
MIPSYQNSALDGDNRAKRRVIKALDRQYANTEDVIISGADMSEDASSGFKALEKKLLLLINLTLEAQADIEQEGEIEEDNRKRPRSLSSSDDERPNKRARRDEGENPGTSSSAPPPSPPRNEDRNRDQRRRPRSWLASEGPPNKRARKGDRKNVSFGGQEAPRKSNNDDYNEGPFSSRPTNNEGPFSRPKRKAPSSSSGVSYTANPMRGHLPETRPLRGVQDDGPFSKKTKAGTNQDAPFSRGGQRKGRLTGGEASYHHSGMFAGILKNILAVIDDASTLLVDISQAFDFLNKEQVFRLTTLLNRSKDELSTLLFLFENFVTHSFVFNRQTKQRMLEEVAEGYNKMYGKLTSMADMYSPAYVRMKTSATNEMAGGGYSLGYGMPNRML